MDPLAERFAAEHKRFLEENNPSVLSQQSDPTSYLSSVGETAADRYRDLMYRHDRSPEVQKLPTSRRSGSYNAATTRWRN
jgi:hypothetical protein